MSDDAANILGGGEDQTGDGGENKPTETNPGGDAGNKPDADNTADGGDNTFLSALDDDMRGFLENRGVLDKPVEEIALNVLKGLRNAEKKLGVAPDRLLTLPADEKDVEAKENIFKALGKPEDSTQYELEVKSDEEKVLADFVREKGFEFNMTQEQAAGMFDALRQFAREQEGSMADAATKQQKQELQALYEEWDLRTNEKLAFGRLAKQRLGLDDDLIKKVDASMGTAATLALLAKVGEAIAPPGFAISGEADRLGGMTKESAQAEYEKLMSDANFRRRYNDGDPAARKKVAPLLEHGAYINPYA